MTAKEENKILMKASKTFTCLARAISLYSSEKSENENTILPFKQQSIW